MPQNETKWTPRPWAQSNDPRTGATIAVVDAGAEVLHVTAQRGSGGSGEANAALIAAAPDLHEALAAVLDIVERQAAGIALTAHDVRDLDAARAALAKAEGRE